MKMEQPGQPKFIHQEIVWHDEQIQEGKMPWAPVIGWLVLTSFKKIVNGKDYAIYYGKLKMFETTNQIFSFW